MSNKHSTSFSSLGFNDTQERQIAKAQVIRALQIASSKLNHARKLVQERTAAAAEKTSGSRWQHPGSVSNDPACRLAKHPSE